jgi:hypothetical protein
MHAARTTGGRFNRKPKPRFKSPLDKAKAPEVVWHQVAPLFEAARRWLNASFIYFIGEPDSGPIKIGFSGDPIGRLRNMQVGNPRRLRMEYVLVGGMETEKLLHQLWEPHAILSANRKGLPGTAPGTEWFKPTAREQLLPIVAEAARFQADLLNADRPEPASFEEMEWAVREAHARSGFVAHVVAPTSWLCERGDYTDDRKIRI